MGRLTLLIYGSLLQLSLSFWSSQTLDEIHMYVNLLYVYIKVNIARVKTYSSSSFSNTLAVKLEVTLANS